MPLIETERLILRELQPEDREGMFLLDSDPQVHRYLMNHTLKNRSEAALVIESILAQYEANGIGRWAVIEKGSGDFVGWSGLRLEDEPMNGLTRYFDIGYRLRPTFWGKGYARESATAALRYGFEEFGLTDVYAAAQIGNVASTRVLEKIGMIRKAQFSDNWGDQYMYQLSKVDWKRHAAGENFLLSKTESTPSSPRSADGKREL
jgi:RimJ/RimL family protein N-acetyltransferase